MRRLDARPACAAPRSGPRAARGAALTRIRARRVLVELQEAGRKVALGQQRGHPRVQQRAVRHVRRRRARPAGAARARAAALARGARRVGLLRARGARPARVGAPAPDPTRPLRRGPERLGRRARERAAAASRVSDGAGRLLRAS